MQRPDEIAERRPRVVGEYFAELLIAGDVTNRTNGEARLVPVDHHETDAGLLRAGLARAPPRKHVVRIERHTGPDLLAINDELVVLLHRFGTQRGKVGPRIRFAVALAPHMLARQDLRQVR